MSAMSACWFTAQGRYDCSRPIERFQEVPLTPDLWAVITTIDAYEGPRSKLRQSLMDAGWPATRTMWVYGASKAPRAFREPDGALHVNIRENLFDHNAFIGAAEAPGISDDTIFVLLHDTSRVGRNMPDRVRKMAEDMTKRRLDILWCTSRGQCNICLFNRKAAIAARSLWSGVTQVSKDTAIRMEWDNDPLSPKRLPGVRQAFHPSSPRDLPGATDWYGTGVLRKTLHFESVDVYKAYVQLDQHTHVHPNRP